MNATTTSVLGPLSRWSLRAGLATFVALGFGYAAHWLRALLPVTVVGDASAAGPPSSPRNGEKLAQALCTSCHALPPPDALPRASWPGEIHKMAAIQSTGEMPSWGQAAEPVPLSPEMEAIKAYYQSRAPEAIPSPEAWPPPDESDPRFVRHALTFADALTQEPAVANVSLVDLDGDPRLEVVVCDMRQGVVLRGRPYDPKSPLTVLAEIPNPDHAAMVDLDGDGIKDLLIADLGDFLPGDHDKGQAVWLRGLPNGGFAQVAFGGFPRVADVEAADFDGDGKLDLIVAAFGLLKTGGITILDNRTVDYRWPSFEPRKLDARAGPIHVVPVDLNKDGLMDFVTVIAQEHETVEAFMNEGGGKFRREVIYRGPHPAWGSSGIQVVDFDGDGDLDVLVTNGDMFDDELVKPYHGIRWLENRGRFPFVEHFLAPLAGVSRAVAVDLDGDGDMDVVASALSPGASANDPRLPSLVWLEQTKPGQFKRHTLEVGHLTHATLDVADFDGDGDLDIVVGNFTFGKPSESFVDVWENVGAEPKPRAATHASPAFHRAKHGEREEGAGVRFVRRGQVTEK